MGQARFVLVHNIMSYRYGMDLPIIDPCGVRDAYVPGTGSVRAYCTTCMPRAMHAPSLSKYEVTNERSLVLYHTYGNAIH